MKRRKNASVAFLSLMILSMLLVFPPVTSISLTKDQLVTRLDQGFGFSSGSGGSKVSIVYPEDGATLYNGTHAIDVYVHKNPIAIDVKVNGTSIPQYGNYSGYYSFYPWNVSAAELGTYNITAIADYGTRKNATATIFVTVVAAGAVSPTYELYIEIDYFGELGHEPNQTVLDYIHDYYHARGINVTFIPDNNITIEDLGTLGVDYTNGINETEFWWIQGAYNDVKVYNDTDPENITHYLQKEKWVLYGNKVTGEPYTLGYSWVLSIGKHMVAGNYIFIADERAEYLATYYGIGVYGLEATVLMHELGHAIGIGILRGLREYYDPDVFSVMSYASFYNTKLYWAWHYSNKYWDTRDMGFYEI